MKSTIILFVVFVSTTYSQKVDLSFIAVNKNSLPFWIVSNRNGILSGSSQLNFSYSQKYKLAYFKIGFNPKYNGNKKTLLNETFIQFNKNNYQFLFGKKNNEDLKSYISTGSLLESTNSLPIPKISIGHSDFHRIQIFDKNFNIKASIGHGWLYKGRYLQAPSIHEKAFHLKKNINGYNFVFGINHKAIWGGETKLHGLQPQSPSDYLRILFARPGSKKSLKQEQENALGNHLGVWDFSLERKIKDKLYTFYYEHPFEDESGARWLLNKFDGKYGFNVTSFKSTLISDFIYEFIYTMDQSGSQGASDSTYGWDNYFNHYIYQSGWTYKNRMIGNPLFTVGKNPGRYSDSFYIINNRIKAHHIGLAGKIRHNANFRILITYSKNYGIYPDKNYYLANGGHYKFDGGLEQLSTLYEIKFKNLWENISITAAYANDRGDLLPKTDSFMMIINYKL